MKIRIHAALALLALTALFSLGAAPASAQVLEPNSDATVRDWLCLGEKCPNNPTGTFTDGLASGLSIRDTRTRIDFEDTSIPGEFPASDWSIVTNDILADAAGGTNFFAIEDRSAGTVPFKIAGSAPHNAFFLDDEGQLGLGTALPQDQLHIVDLAPSVRFETTTGEMSEIGRLSSSTFYVYDHDTFAYPFLIDAGAPNGAVSVDDDGHIGLGTTAPAGKLHTRGNGVQLAYFESGDGGPVQVRFRTDSENRRFLAVNNANEVKSQLIFLDDRINFTGETDSGANLWLSVGPDGIVSQGPTCDPGPCDAVFDPEVFEVPDIKERAAKMWEAKHLPAIGPTKPHAPINLTEKMGGVIHELELAHIFIERQQTEIETLKSEHAKQIATLTARLEALESQ